MTSYTGAITRLSEESFKMTKLALMTGAITRLSEESFNNKAFRRIIQVALMTSYTGAITRLSEESFKWH